MSTPAQASAAPPVPAVEGGQQTPPAVAAPVAPSAQAAPVESFWQKAKEVGEEKARAEFAAKLKSIFGTNDLAQIEAIAKKAQGKSADSDEAAVKKIMEEMDKLKAERDSLIHQIEAKAMRDRVMSEIMSSSHRLHDVNETLDLLMLKYDFKMLDDKLVLHHKESGNPVFLDGNIGTVSAILDAWAKDPKQAWRFQSASQIATPSGKATQDGPDAGNYTYVVKPTDFSTPGFLEALQRSGQKQLAYEGKPIDYERLKPYLLARK
jgi:hypothetical protein